jgi:hypothetical protein
MEPGALVNGGDGKIMGGKMIGSGRGEARCVNVEPVRWGQIFIFEKV